MGRHCADNNARAQRYLFSDRFQISGDHGTQLLRAIRLRENHSDEKITHREVGWSPLRNHPVYVRGGQVSDWEESQVLAALAVSELQRLCSDGALQTAHDIWGNWTAGASHGGDSFFSGP